MKAIEFVISACLAGVSCRYDGGDNAHALVMELVRQGRAILVCPEQLGGLATPRMPSEIRPCEAQGARCVVQKTASSTPEELLVCDVTDAFARGAYEALKIAQLAGCTKAIVKARSPSCGYGRIYDGTFTKTIIAGHGFFTEALISANFSVQTEEDLLFLP